MSIYLDSAIVIDARAAAVLRFVAGVTTNPNLMAEAGRPGLDVIRDLLEAIDGDVFYQVTSPSLAAKYDEARQLFELAPARIVIKIPAATEHFALVRRLADEGVRVCVTAVYSPAQAYLAAQTGAAFVATYVSRITRHLGDANNVVRDLAQILKGSETRLLAASLKSVEEVVGAILAGAHDVTIPLALIKAMGEHRLSQAAMAEFAQRV